MSVERTSARIGRTVQIDDSLADACLEIVRDLPDYFDESDFEELERELRTQDRTLYFAEKAGEVSGFALVERRGERIAEICWLAVGPEFRGQGVGSALVEDVFEAFAPRGSSCWRSRRSPQRPTTCRTRRPDGSTKGRAFCTWRRWIPTLGGGRRTRARST